MSEMQENDTEESKKENKIKPDGLLTMFNSDEPIKENNKEENQELPIITKDGMFAVEMPDEVPPLEHVKFLDEAGQFKDAKPYTKEDLAYYWRSKQRMVSIVMAISSFGMLIIMLSATTKYTNELWNIIMFCFNFVLSFIIELLPASAFSWIPF